MGEEEKFWFTSCPIPRGYKGDLRSSHDDIGKQVLNFLREFGSGSRDIVYTGTNGSRAHLVFREWKERKRPISQRPNAVYVELADERMYRRVHEARITLPNVKLVIPEGRELAQIFGLDWEDALAKTKSKGKMHIGAKKTEEGKLSLGSNIGGIIMATHADPGILFRRRGRQRFYGYMGGPIEKLVSLYDKIKHRYEDHRTKPEITFH